MFPKLPLSNPSSLRPKRLFLTVVEHLRPLFEDPPFVVDPKKINAAPAPTQHVYWLWKFLCEVEGNMLDVFLLNHLGNWTPKVRDALRAVGARDVVPVLDAGIPLAIKGHAEFARHGVPEWASKLSGDPELSDWKAVNSAMSAKCPAIGEKVHQYLLDNREVFFA